MVDTDKTFTYSTIKIVKFDSALEYEIYPNPVSDVLKIKGIQTEDLRAMVISNPSGKIVYRSGPKVKSEIELTGLSAGLYVLKLWKTDGSEMAKSIVVRK